METVMTATIIRAVFLASGGSPQQDSRLKFRAVPIMAPAANNLCIAYLLHMGDPDGVSRYCTECRSGKRPVASAFQAKIAHIRV